VGRANGPARAAACPGRRDPGIALEVEGAEVELASTGGAYGLMHSDVQQHVRPR
jgi:hypothetical protein